MKLELEGTNDVVLVDGDLRVRIGASLDPFGYGGSMDRDTWGEAELYAAGPRRVVLTTSVCWESGSPFLCERERWVSENGGASWSQTNEAQDEEDAPSLAFVTTDPSGKRSRMVAWNRIEEIWATLRAWVPSLPKEAVRGWAGPGAKALGRLSEERRGVVRRRLAKIAELERVP
jgi:hypothetical protein